MKLIPHGYGFVEVCFNAVAVFWISGACLHQELLQQEHLPGADATANTANTANNEC